MVEVLPITNSLLLPRNSTPFEKAIADLTAYRMPSMRDLWNPAKIRVDLLPWLAWALSVDFWDENWSEERKRYVVGRSLQMHARKGTLKGITDYIELADGKVLKALTPPSKTYMMPALTRDERESFLAKMPQLRVFMYKNNGVATKGAFLSTEATTFPQNFLGEPKQRSFNITYEDGGDLLLEQSTSGLYFEYLEVPTHCLVDENGAPIMTEVADDFEFINDEGAPPGADIVRWPGMWPYQTDAAQRFGRRTFFWDRGVETECQRLERTQLVEGKTAYDFELTFIPGNNKATIFPGENVHPRMWPQYLMPALASDRTFATRVERTYEDRSESLRLSALPYGQGLDPIDIRPQLVFEKGNSRGYGVFPQHKRCFTNNFLVTSTAEDRVYERLYLHDPTRLPDDRKRSTHVGFTRLGMPAFHAELVAGIQGKRYARQAGRFVSGFTYASSQAPLNKVVQATKLSKSARDKVLLNTKTYRPIRAGDGVRVGAFKVGQFVRM
jgi:phage tail-like protein